MTSLMSFFADCADAGVAHTRERAPSATKDDVVFLAQALGLRPVELSKLWTFAPLKARFTVVPQEMQDALFNLAHATHHVLRLQGSATWLAQPAAELRGRVPASLVQTLHGAEFVFAAIERMKPSA